MPYVGTVVDGILNSGTVKAGDAVLFGPDSNGNFHGTVVKTIERKRYVRRAPKALSYWLYADDAYAGHACRVPRRGSVCRSRSSA